MKVEAGLVCLRSKISKPCRRLLRVFKFRLKKPFSIKSLWGRRRPGRSVPSSTSKPRRAWPLLRWLRRGGRKMESVREVRSVVSEGVHERLLFPSPMTPARGGRKSAEMEASEEVEDACRSFENYLVEMMVEEGKVRDLNDVEELLYCWKNLKCPVFVDLVCRFYGELCKDLFSTEKEPFIPNLLPRKN